MKISLFIFLLLCSSPLFSKLGSSSERFLKIIPSARQTGIGGIQAAVSEDINTLQGNPAGLGLIKRAQLSASYFKGILDTSYNWLGLALPMDVLKHSVTLGFTTFLFDGGNIDIDDGVNITTKNAEQSLLFGISAGTKIGEVRWLQYLSVGATFKFFQTKLVNEYTSSSAAIDLGCIYRVPETRLRVGIFFSNIGIPVKFINEYNQLPMSVKAGIAYRIAFISGNSALIGMDISTSLDNKININSGIETKFGALFLRTGYRTSDLNPLSFGIGLKMSDIQFDYSISILGFFPTTHRASLTIYLGELPEGGKIGASRVIRRWPRKKPEWIDQDIKETQKNIMESIVTKDIQKKTNTVEEGAKLAFAKSIKTLTKMYINKVEQDLINMTKDWTVNPSQKEAVITSIKEKLDSELPISTIVNSIFRRDYYYEKIEEVVDETGETENFYNYYVLSELPLVDYRDIRKNAIFEELQKAKKKGQNNLAKEIKNLLRRLESDVGTTTVIEKRPLSRPDWVTIKKPEKINDNLVWVKKLDKKIKIIAETDKIIRDKVFPKFKDLVINFIKHHISANLEAGPLTTSEFENLKNIIFNKLFSKIESDFEKYIRTYKYYEKIEEVTDLDGGFSNYYNVWVELLYPIENYRQTRRKILSLLRFKFDSEKKYKLKKQIVSLQLKMDDVFLGRGEKLIMEKSPEISQSWVKEHFDIKLSDDKKYILCKQEADKVSSKKEGLLILEKLTKKKLSEYLKERAKRTIRRLSKNSGVPSRIIRGITSAVVERIENMKKNMILQKPHCYWEKYEIIIDENGNTSQYFNCAGLIKLPVKIYKKAIEEELDSWAEGALKGGKRKIVKGLIKMLKKFRKSRF